MILESNLTTLTSADFQTLMNHSLSQKVIDQIKAQGFAEIENFLNTKALDSTEEFVKTESEKRKQLNFSLLENELQESIIAYIAKDPLICKLMEDVSLGLGFKTYRKKYYTRMRAKLGQDSSVDELNFHFDSSFLTFSIAIKVPPPSYGGGLLLQPRARRFSLSAWHNRLTRRYYSSRWFGGKKLESSRKMKEIFYKPNSLFIFEGFTTLHATGRMTNHASRIVVLMHSGDVPVGGDLAY